MTWAASDLTLLSEVQSRLPEAERPRAMSFLYAAFVLLVAGGSVAAGRFLDAVSLGAGFIGLNVAFTVLAAVVWWASRRIER